MKRTLTETLLWVFKTYFKITIITFQFSNCRSYFSCLQVLILLFHPTSEVPYNSLMGKINHSWYFSKHWMFFKIFVVLYPQAYSFDCVIMSFKLVHSLKDFSLTALTYFFNICEAIIKLIVFKKDFWRILICLWKSLIFLSVLNREILAELLW